MSYQPMDDRLARLARSLHTVWDACFASGPIRPVAELGGGLEWDPQALDDWAWRRGGATVTAAALVLNVYNNTAMARWNTPGGGHWRCGTFDIIRARQTFDREQWAAVCAWVADPFTL